mgnify:CR=1 FL=1
MKRYLAIDLGDNRTGLAVGDDMTNIVGPAGQIAVPVTADEGRSLLDAIAKACDERLGPDDELVVGLPMNMDGSEGPRAKIVRAWAKRIQDRTGRTVHLAADRKSTQRADEQMARTGLTHGQKKQRRDALAAKAILERFLADRDQTGSGGALES